MATKATASAASASNGASSAASVIRSTPSTPHQNSSGTMAKISGINNLMVDFLCEISVKKSKKSRSIMS